MKKNLLFFLVLLLFSLASCNASLVTYEVAWDVDGNIHIEKYTEGETPLYKFSTEKESDNAYAYKFIGWDKEVVSVTENTTYVAQYEKIKIDVKYTYTWVVNDNKRNFN